jgi:membrane-bound lytic murein transglycosylase B
MAGRPQGLVLAALMLVGICTPAPAAAPADAVAAPQSENARFRAFLLDFKAEALGAGVRPDTYDRAVAGIGLNARVEELNERQPEFTRPVWDYIAGALPEARIARGRAQLAANRELFAGLRERYGVPPEVLTAIWGLETGFGQNTGTYNLFEALGTLSFDGPRVSYGRRQFIAALKIADMEGRDPTTMTGSWAGAFGHTQFIPTTYLEHAVDGDGDGKRDVWNSPADALASAAHYLSRSGWRAKEVWGEEVKLPADFAYETAEIDLKRPVADWAMRGVRKISGAPLTEDGTEAAIFLPAGHRGPAFLVRSNFGAILRYNAATAYALAIGLFSERLEGGGVVQAAWPLDETPLDRTSRIALQNALTALGYATGSNDGVMGRRTRQSIREYQKARGLPADGFASGALLARIRNERPQQP